MNIWHDVKPELVRRDEYTVFSASSMGSPASLSFDTDTGLLKLDHLSDAHIGAPYNTGFLPRTRTPEGLPIESILLCSQPIPAMTLVRCRPIGMAVLHLENGGTRQYLVSVVCADDFWSACLTVDEIPTVNRRALVRYLRLDQQMICEPVSSIEFLDLEQAEKYFDACERGYLVHFCGRLPQPI